MPDRSITVRLRAEVGDFQRALGQAKTSTQEFSRGVAGMARDNSAAMTSVGMAAAGAGLAIAAGLGAGVKAAIDWESAFTGVRKTVEATDAQLAEMNRGLRDMALEIPVAATELAGIAESAGQLGIATEDVLDFTKVMAELAVTTDLTSEQAATGFAQIVNIMGTAGDQFDELGSVLVDLGNKGASTESQILDFALRIAGAGKIAGLTEANVFAIGSAMASVGVEAEAGGTAVQKVLLGMTEAAATGGDDLGTFARVAGVTADEFATMWERDAGEAFTRFVEGLGRSGTDAFGILDELGLKDQRLIRSFLSLAGAGDLMRQNLDNANSALEENVALGREAQLRFETMESKLQLLKSAFVELGIGLGEVLLPILTPLVEGVTDMVSWFSQLPEPVQTAGVVVAGLASALGILGGGALILIPRIVAVIDALRTLKTVAGGVRLPNLGRGVPAPGIPTPGPGAVGTGLAVGGAVIATGMAVQAGIDLKQNIDTEQARLAQQLAGMMQAANAGDQQMAERVKEFRTNMIDNQSWWSRTAFWEIGAQSEQIWAQAEQIVAGASDSYQDAAARMGEARLAAVGMNEAASDSVGVFGDLSGQSKTLAERLADAAEEGDTLSSVMLGFISPVGQAYQALGNMADASDRVNELLADGKYGTEEWGAAMFGLAEAKATAQAAIDTLSAQGIEITADSMAKALNVPRSEADHILQTLGLLDGSTFTTVLQIEERLTSAVKGGTASRAQFGSLGRRAEGGPVDPGGAYWVGERGRPELFVPSAPGSVLNEQTLARMVGGRGGITLAEGAVTVVYPTPEPASESVPRELRRLAAALS